MHRGESLSRNLLRIPLFYKILVANSAIVGLGAVIGTMVTVWHVQTYQEDIHFELIAIFASAGVLVSYLVNQWALKLALTPLDRLQEGVDAVALGDLSVRVTSPPVSDTRFDRLVDTFNLMLDQLEKNAQQLRWLSHRILQAQEDERQRLARELHDEAAQALTSLLVHLRLLERAYQPEEAQQRVKELRELTAEALEEVRRVALDLRPTILDDLGLIPALEWRIDEINQTGGARATLFTSGINGRLPREIELVFYRIGQEALTNALRHAGASEITVTLQHDGSQLCLEVSDDGIGFTPEAVEGGLGLVGMRERIGMIGGVLAIDSAPDQGCRLRVETPLGPEQGTQDNPWKN